VKEQQLDPFPGIRLCSEMLQAITTSPELVHGRSQVTAMKWGRASRDRFDIGDYTSFSDRIELVIDLQRYALVHVGKKSGPQFSCSSSTRHRQALSGDRVCPSWLLAYGGDVRKSNDAASHVGRSLCHPPKQSRLRVFRSFESSAIGTTGQRPEAGGSSKRTSVRFDDA
jgi:hypothetical protein